MPFLFEQGAEPLALRRSRVAELLSRHSADSSKKGRKTAAQVNLEENGMNLITKSTTLLSSVLIVIATSPANSAGSNTVSTPAKPKNAIVLYDSSKAPTVPNRVAVESIPNSQMPADTICNLASRVAYGDPAPRTGGGTLGTIAPFFDTTINSSGNVAFGSTVVGSDRNQGFFISNSDGTVNAVAIGCG